MIWTVFTIAFASVFLGYAASVLVDRRLKRNIQPAEGNAVGETRQVETAQAREILARVQELTGSVSQDMYRHRSRVAEVSSDLQAAGDTDSQAVLQAANKLVEANQQLQEELESARAEITFQRQQLDSYITEARTDSLTNIANRRAFDQELDRRFNQWLRDRTPLWLLLIDVDDFKRFNDEYGHQAGDATLCSTARVLDATSSETGFLARYGGEEFAVIIAQATRAEAESRAEEMRAAVARQSVADSRTQAGITISIGLAEACASDDRATFVKRADTALYAAKEAGRDASYYHNGEECERVVISRRREIERIAYVENGQFPHEETFQGVQCLRCSASRFSYLRPESPQFQIVLAILKQGNERHRHTAVVENYKNIGTESDPLFYISCRFVSASNESTSTASRSIPAADDAQSSPSDQELAVALNESMGNPLGEDSSSV